MIPKEKWEWFGSPGHFICCRWCRFHLTTRIGLYVVSTVGEYVHPRHGNGSEQKEAEWLKENYPGEDIGYQRKYETMVFLFTGKCDSEECGCGMPTHGGHELYFEGYNRAKEATEGHMKACEIYSKKEAKAHTEGGAVT